MKNSICLLIIVLFGLYTHGEELSKTYHFSEYNIVNTGDYQLVEFDGCLNTGYAGAPSLPWYAVKILLPPGEQAVSFIVEGSNEVMIPGNFTLYPQQSSRPISKGNSGEFKFDDVIYQSQSNYPSEAHGIISTEYMNGHGIAFLNICPLLYTPASGQLSYYTNMTVTLITEKTRSSEDALKMLNSSKTILSRVADFVHNPEMLDKYPATENRSDAYQLLIITDESYENEFEQLRELYMYRGLRSAVMTTQSIDNTISGQDLQEKIRNYIIQEYQDNSIEFVLLGGDVEYVPYRGFYCYVESGSGYSDDNIPADLYYNALDGNWNDDGDNLWGEIGEDDLLPEIAIGRYTFSNQDELDAMLNKTITYQDAPILGELANPLLAGEYLYNDPLTYGSDYMRLLVGYRDDNGYTTIGIPPEQNIDSLYELHESWNGSTLIARINEGKSFIHHCGHANTNYVMHLSNSDITNANFSQVNGLVHNFTFVQSHGCICGAFDASDCIMERMLAIDNFAAAIIGNSRYGWFNEGQTEGPSAHLHREMVDALYTEKMGRIGTAFMESKIQTAPWVNAPGQHEEGALRWNYYDINILGDPTLQLWTDEPFNVDAIYTDPIQVGSASMDVSVLMGSTPVEGLSCTLTKDGIMHGTAVTDASGDAVIVFDPMINTMGTALLTISGYNCLTKNYNVAVSPAGEPYIIVHDYLLDDNAGGNANGLPDFGESILMTVNLKNAGIVDASNVVASLSCENELINITDSEGNYGSIAAGEFTGSLNDYAFEIDAFVPDQHPVEFALSISGDGKDNWFDDFSIVLNAPVIENGLMSIDDAAGGNGDGFLDPGENATLYIGVLNTGHADAPGAEASLNTLSSWVSITNSNFIIGDLLQSVYTYASFEISVDEDAPLGTTVVFSFEVSSGDYQATTDYAATIGLLVEDWESGGFTTFNWQFAGDSPWTMSTDEPYEGTYCAKSGEIGDDQESELFLYIDVLAGGDLSFYRKVSSETEWDYLRFYIDYTLQGEWSGELGWEKVSFPVTQGLHTFRWVYEKDSYTSSGEDCAWIDYIVLPPVDLATGINNHKQEQDGFSLTLHPNPAKNTLYVDYSLNTSTNVGIMIYDLQGQRVMNVLDNSRHAQGTYNLQVDISGIKPGIYLCRIITEKGTESRKLIVQ